MGRALKVLVVDDQPSLREIMVAELEHLGPYQIASCATLDEALAMTAGVPFDLLVSDFSLQSANAVELLVLLDARQPRPSCKRYIVSGYTRTELAPKFAGHRVDRYYQKPVDFDQLGRDIDADFATPGRS